VNSVRDAGRVAALGELSEFRQEFYQCLSRRADACFELADALLCTDGRVDRLVGLSLAAEHRRGHGALYDAVNQGVVEIGRLRRALAGLPLPRDRAGRIVLAVDVSAWLRPDAATSPDRAFCHVHGRGKSAAQMIPGWPYSFVATLETGRSSWTAILDAVRVTPADDLTVVTATQVREVVDRLPHCCAATPSEPELGPRRVTYPAQESGGRAQAYGRGLSDPRNMVKAELPDGIANGTRAGGGRWISPWASAPRS
jgi:hypothetical protein